MWLYRPLLADPPMISYADLVSSLTIDDMADMAELLDLRAVILERTRPKA